MANTIRSESGRVFEYVPLGAIKFNASTGAPEGAGAKEAEPEGTVSVGALNVITGLSAVTNIVVGSKVSDDGQKKFFPAANGAEVTAVNATAKTVTVSVPAERATVVTAELTKANEAVKIKFLNQLVAAGAETLTIPLESGAYQFTDYAIIESNIVESTTPEVTIELQTTYDGGKTWVKAEGSTATASQTGNTKNLTEQALKEKVNGGSFRLGIVFAKAGAVAGYVQLATGHSPYKSR